MKRRSVLRAGVAGGRVLRFVPQANLTVLDPIVTTAAVTANHAWMVWDTLFGVNAAQRAKPQMADGYTISDDGRTYLIKLREGVLHGNRCANHRWVLGRSQYDCLCRAHRAGVRWFYATANLRRPSINWIEPAGPSSIGCMTACDAAPPSGSASTID